MLNQKKNWREGIKRMSWNTLTMTKNTVGKEGRTWKRERLNRESGGWWVWYCDWSKKPNREGKNMNVWTVCTVSTIELNLECRKRGLQLRANI